MPYVQKSDRKGWAFTATSNACQYTLCLTGTLAGGYASDLYYLLFRTHPRLMIEDGNKWGNPIKFMEKYGILERITTITDQDGLTTKVRKKEIQVECHVTESKPIQLEKKPARKPVLKTLSLEAEQIGNKIVKVEFIEYIGRRKKKVTHVEVTQAELDEMIADSETPTQAQFTLF